MLLKKILRRLGSGGALVIGKTERLPEEVPDLEPWFPNHRIYRKVRPPLALGRAAPTAPQNAS